MRKVFITTQTAWLRSDGYGAFRVTRHTYVGSKVVKKLGDRNTMLKGQVHYFRCAETGAVREWGFDVAPCN